MSELVTSPLPKASNTIPDGEIVVKEKYGSRPTTRFYVKPPGQNRIVIVDEEPYHISDWFTKLFLPQGYPDSVSKDYLAYQVWDTAQAFCSTITGTLATQEVLRGVGVGDTTATPLAATVIWVLKDGCGHIGRILFAFSHGTVMKAVVGVAGGATRAAMTQHHAIRGNMADVSAKDSAQETAVNLIASLTALLIITIFGNSLTIFALMMILHITFNYFAVRAVCLRTLNEPRFLHVIDTYLSREMVTTPCSTNQQEPIIFYNFGLNLLDLKLCGFRIKLGASIKECISEHRKSKYIMNMKRMYSKRKYVLIPCIYKRKMYVLLKDNASTGDILCAYFHAVLLSIILCAINDYPLAVFHNKGEARPFARVCQTLQSADWCRQPTETAFDSQSGFLYDPTDNLISYVDKIVQVEWSKMRSGLVTTGWDLSKHLLMVDEWRVCSEQFESNIDTTSPVSYIMELTKIPFGNVITDYNSRASRAPITIEPEDS